MSEINQQFIADQLGISRATVSRCFTNHPGINPETRAKVFELAAQHGYAYQETKTRNRKPKRKQLKVGVLVCSTEEEYFRPDFESPGEQLMKGVSEFAQLRRIHLDVRFVNPGATIEDPAVRPIIASRRRAWDGILLIYPFSPVLIQELALRYPLVSLVEQYGKAAINCIDVDHYKGIAAIIDQLRIAGHERIGFYTRQYPVEAGWSLHRFSGFCEKLARLRLPLVTEDMVNIHPNVFPKNSEDPEDQEESHDYVESRIRDGVTAWVCAADHQAYGLIEGLERRGFQVPRDVSVTGFDGIHQPPGAPSLSTMAVPYSEIGLAGGKRLLDIITKRFHLGQHILVASRLREGETIGPARRGGPAPAAGSA